MTKKPVVKIFLSKKGHCINHSMQANIQYLKYHKKDIR